MSKDWMPRLSVDISEEQFFALQTLVPHGAKKKIFKIIINDLIKILESDARIEFLGMVLSENCSLIDYSPLTRKALLANETRHAPHQHSSYVVGRDYGSSPPKEER